MELPHYPYRFFQAKVANTEPKSFTVKEIAKNIKFLTDQTFRQRLCKVTALFLKKRPLKSARPMETVSTLENGLTRTSD